MLDTKKSPVAELIMRRKVHTGSFLLVEGSDDWKFWILRCHNTCELVDGGGKSNVISGMRDLDAMRFEGVLAVVDSNYDHLAGFKLPSDNIVRTDAHDLECLLCRSPALDAVLAEYGDQDKIERFERERTSVRTALLNNAVVLGRLRWAAKSLDLVLKEFDAKRFIDKETWLFDEEQMLEIAAAQNPHVGKDALEGAIAAQPLVDPWYVARGHDVLAILQVGLHHILGAPRPPTVGQLASVLRQSMSAPELQSTKMWQDMCDWQASNCPFLVLQEQ